MTDKNSARKSRYLFSFTEVIIFLVVSGLLVGFVLSIGTILELSRMRAQISQLSHFDEAVTNFHEKFDGLPGDLLSVVAEREGLPAGNGTPSHSDGDGKISPCNPGWQNHLGCETALFWTHLASTGFIPGDFNADNRLTDERLVDVSVTLAPYLPQSPIREGVYVAVWNSDDEQPSPPPALPYGNYFELSRLMGIVDEKIVDDPGALMPKEAFAIDEKMDDGSPVKGRILVNGNGKWPEDAWGSLAKPDEKGCVAPNKTYNTANYFIAAMPTCHLAVAIPCCRGAREK
jgi:hypothetical protein